MPPAHTSRLPKTSNTAMAMYLLLAVALVAPALSAPNPGLREYPEYRCAEGWRLVDQSCFLLADVSGNWEASQIFCNAEGAALATISSELQQETLKSFLTESVWIGLNDMKEENVFAWADGSESNFTSWAENEPNSHWLSGGEDCVEMRKVKDFQWNDESCELIRQ
ncbi:C-type lectin [Chionoecetes opilio]|uniref:C-type lectin n=1 Tax=Chionoecetes opilio TaxID=41210 RepID=A0A8J4XVF4_CHIOP|nr:C-type lectin [Chionoecetes opilio]